MVKVFNQQFKKGQGDVQEANQDILLGSEDFLVEVDASSGPVTVTLFRADGWGGKRFCIKKIDNSVNVVTIVPIAGQTIDGVSSVELVIEGQSIDVISNGENYGTISESSGPTISIVKSFVFATVSTSQITNIGANDHIKYDIILESRGTNIVLDTATLYTAALGVPSVGRLTLKAGKTYKISVVVPILTGPGPNLTSDMMIRDVTIGVAAFIGKGSGATSPDSVGTTSYSGNQLVAIFKPTVDSLIEYTIGSNVNFNSILVEAGNLNRAPIILIEEI